MQRETHWVTVGEFLTLHKGRLGRSSLYDRIKDGSIPAIRLGRKILIPSDALDRVLSGIGTSGGGVGR